MYASSFATLSWEILKKKHEKLFHCIVFYFTGTLFFKRSLDNFDISAIPCSSKIKLLLLYKRRFERNRPIQHKFSCATIAFIDSWCTCGWIMHPNLSKFLSMSYVLTGQIVNELCINQNIVSHFRGITKTRDDWPLGDTEFCFPLQSLSNINVYCFPKMQLSSTYYQSYWVFIA